jgi:hypothetical protein
VLAIVLGVVPGGAPRVARADHPEALVAIGHIDFTQLPCSDVAVDDGYAYVGTYSSNKVFITDVRNPFAARHATTYATTSGTGILDIAVREGVAVFALDTGGVEFVDVTDPEQPRLLSYYDQNLPAGVHNAFLDGRYAYLVDDGSGGIVTIVDYEDATAPREVAVYSPSGRPHDITVVGDVCYMANLGGGFEIVDVSDRSRPRQVAAKDYAGAVTHNIWPTEDGTRVVTTDESCPNGRLRLWDVSDPSAIRETSTFSVRDQSSCVHNAQILGDYVFMSYYNHGLQVAKIDGSSLRKVASFDTWDGSRVIGFGCFEGAWGVAAEPAPDGSTIVYVSDISTGLWVFRFTGGHGEPPAPVAGLDGPYEGAQLTAGETVELRWQLGNAELAHALRLELSLDDGATYATIADGLPPETTSYLWTVPAATSSRARVRLTVDDGSGQPSAGVSGRFTLSATSNRAPYLALGYPAGGETLRAGSRVPVAWVAEDDDPLDVRVELSTDGGATYATTLEVTTDANGRGTWTVPDVRSTDARLRVVASDGVHPAISEATPASFTISAAGSGDAIAPSADLSPLAVGIAGAGMPVDLSFEASDGGGGVLVVAEITTDDGRSWRTFGVSGGGAAKHLAESFRLPASLPRGVARVRLVAVDASGNAAVAEAGGSLAVLPLPRVDAVRFKGRGRKAKVVVTGEGFTAGESIVSVDGEGLTTRRYARRGSGGEAGRIIADASSLAEGTASGAVVRVEVANPSTGQRSNLRLASRD